MRRAVFTRINNQYMDVHQSQTEQGNRREIRD